MPEVNILNRLQPQRLVRGDRRHHWTNGAGKSTLLKAMLGLVTLGSGTVRCGQDITGRKAFELVERGVAPFPRLAMLSQSDVTENLEMGCFLSPGPSRTGSST